MGKRATKKIVGHPELLPGESVIDAVWGAGAAMMKMAKRAGPKNMTTWEEIDEVKGKGEGLADAISSNGILALTDRRLLWCPVTTKIGKPDHLVGFDFDDIAGLRHDKPLVMVDFKDGSSGGIRSDFFERPGDFMKTYESMRPASS